MMALENDESTEARQEPAYRLRVGLTGLAVVVMIIVLATLIATGVGRKAALETSASAPLSNNAAVAASGTDAAEPSEPLAKLGMTPGGQANQQDGAPLQPGQ